eukprot:9471398-Pyramimonas_sp.AAC.1
MLGSSLILWKILQSALICLDARDSKQNFLVLVIDALRCCAVVQRAVLSWVRLGGHVRNREPKIHHGPMLQIQSVSEDARGH